MARPRKQLIPIEAEAKEFLESKKGTQKNSLTVRETVALVVLAGLIARGGPTHDARSLKQVAYDWADLFLED